MNERGFTLIEFLVAIAVGVVVLLGIGGFFLSTLRLSAQSSSQTFLQRQGTMIIDEMARQIRFANGVCKDPDPSKTACPGTCPANPSLKVTQPGAPGTGFYCFYLSGDQLVERTPTGGDVNLLAGSPVPLKLTSGSLTFCFNPPACGAATGDKVDISFQLSDGTGVEPMRFGVSLVVRN